jgi:hypothetical protein
LPCAQEEALELRGSLAQAQRDALEARANLLAGQAREAVALAEAERQAAAIAKLKVCLCPLDVQTSCMTEHCLCLRLRRCLDIVAARVLRVVTVRAGRCSVPKNIGSGRAAHKH